VQLQLQINLKLPLKFSWHPLNPFPLELNRAIALSPCCAYFPLSPKADIPLNSISNPPSKMAIASLAANFEVLAKTPEAEEARTLVLTLDTALSGGG